MISAEGMDRNRRVPSQPGDEASPEEEVGLNAQITFAYPLISAKISLK
jgi:hypothetical protein